MKHLIGLFLFMAFTANAELDATFGLGTAQQVFAGPQGSDRATAQVKFDISVEAKNNYPGIQSVVGYQFTCPGNPHPNKYQEVDSTSKNVLNLYTPDTNALYYNDWPLGEKTCFIEWSAASIGTQASNGESLEITIDGVFGSVTLNSNSTYMSPTYRKAKSGANTFKMLREAVSGTGGGC